MSKILGAILALAIALVVGFLVGRASGGVDDRELRDSLAVYREHRKLDREALDSSRQVIAAAQMQTRQAETEAAEWRTKARTGELQAGRHRARADSLWRLLALAPTAGDSLPILVRACTELRQECAALREANASLHQAATADSGAKAGLRTEIAAHQGQRSRDSARLAEADGLVVKLEKAARGCRIPLVAIPCPVLVGEYSLDDQAFRAGAAVPVKIGRLGTVMFSITTRVAGRQP